MGLYSVLYRLVGPQLRERMPSMSAKDRYRAARQIEAWEYGSGSDYRYQPPEL